MISFEKALNYWFMHNLHDNLPTCATDNTNFLPSEQKTALVFYQQSGESKIRCFMKFHNAKDQFLMAFTLFQ